MPPTREFCQASLARSIQESVDQVGFSLVLWLQIFLYFSLKERSLVRTLAENAYPSLAAYLPHLALPSNPFMPKPDPSHPFFLTPASSFHFSSLFSGDLGKPGRRRKARTVFSDAQLAGLERRWENKIKSFDILQV